MALLKAIIQDTYGTKCSCTSHPLITQPARRHEFFGVYLPSECLRSQFPRFDASFEYATAPPSPLSVYCALFGLSFHLSTYDGTPINNAYQYIVIPKALCISKCQKSSGRAKSLKTPHSTSLRLCD
ncbi:hypothetical protein QQF64_022826 [Cirrhinus molitorella]|uniref:Uncharacterized protein n=1 Tax=Cirrhinus molitorella TaxID=172907 RepID=A0ABR3L4V6_9TELE